MKKTYLFLFTLTIFSSCLQESEEKNGVKKKKIDEKEFLDHIRLNDSIEFRIKEYDLNNAIKRNICVFKNDSVIKEHPIYFVRKKEILDEGYNSTKRKLYTTLDYNLLIIKEFNYHYYDYKLENIDSSNYLLKVTETGEIEIEK